MASEGGGIILPYFSLLHGDRRTTQMASAAAAVRRSASLRRQVPGRPWRPDLSASDARTIWNCALIDGL
eukprot:2452661-Pleurochrysis_carterae.AAC.5